MLCPRPKPRDLLPDGLRGRVTVRLDTDVHTFLARAAAVLAECGEWKNTRPGAKASKSIWADYTGPETFHPVLSDMWMGLVADGRQGHEPKVAAVNISSSHYAELDYESYVRVVRLLNPAIRLYNRKHGARLRLRIPSRDSLEPRLSIGASEYLERALIDMPYKPIDIRFDYYYGFIGYMHRHHVQMEAGDLGRVLECRGLESWLISDLVLIYRHGRNLLRWK